ncbi:von Willebrand factor [Pelobates cultripes]|uniref:von Willebrand factor n=1 Tax=Pelobates cultripes TaxID=61616 RepID=A0AAD1VWK9_PELCU|nr:von Willebrand factor [Pelobates cultripes]
MSFLQILPFMLITLLSTGTFSPLVVEGKLDSSFLSRCSLFGENHIRTFDGTFYDFAGDCSYMMAGECHKRSFSLLVDYRKGKKKSVSMYLGEYFDIHVFLDGTATQGDKSISMPYAANGIFLETEAGYYKLMSQEHGFIVKIDTRGNIQVFLSNKLFNKTCGLCGNYNQLAEDDFMTQEGIMADRSYDFANSWALYGGEKRCKRMYPPDNICNVSSEVAEKGFMQRCEIMKTNDVFMKCHHIVNPEPYVSLCEDDMCTCAEEMDCPCQVFLEYARVCAQHGVILSSWSTYSTCKPQCPFGMEYNECVSPCIKTCQSLGINEVCKEKCIDGCTCPDGKVLDGDRCIEESECSCIYSGKRYHVGSVIQQDCNSCTCNRGLWECSSEDCPGECFVTGQSHFKSFDNKHFTFSGICHYLLAKDTMDNSFSVVIETVQCADDQDAVCIRSASVRLQEDMQNITIKLKHGGMVALDGQDILLPLLQGPLRIQTTVMSSVRLSYKDDLQIDWDGHGKLLVKVSSIYSDYTSGLCGNYNGNQGDDFLSPSGLVEPSVEDFGNSWKLSGDCEDVVKQDTDPCSLNPKRARYADEVCLMIMTSTFEPCHDKVNPEPYLKNCRYDVCSCSDGKECMCSAFSMYAVACSRKGVIIDWRTPEFCPLKCSEGKIYQQCRSPCNQTCRSLSLPDSDCREYCMEGCYCPAGLFVNELGECVSKAQCSCYYDGELFQPDDIFSDHHSMCYCENGQMHCSSNALGAYFTDDFFTESSARVKRSLLCNPPLEKIICSANNPKATGMECAKTCQNYDHDCISYGCISGCMCPRGRVQHKTKCIVPERCPCFHAGNEYAPGESVQIDCNTCVCQNRKWQCTKNVCDATCSAIGIANYITFDGLKYSFPGDCQYVLAQDYCNGGSGSFRILVRNEGCGISVEKCSKIITILFRSGEIELIDEQVYIAKPPVDEANFEVLHSGKFIILILGNDISIAWDKKMTIYVTLKENFKDKVCGLCGNFDGSENNDLTSSNNQVEVYASDFGNSWKVHSQCADSKKFPAGKALLLCQQNSLKQSAVEIACDILTGEIFAECEKLVNPEPYREICMYETCSCESIGDCACFCDSVAAYAHACAQKGVNIYWRTPHLCPQSCEEKNKKELEYVCEWRYNSCAPACPVTCQHPEKMDCPFKCVEGCHANCPSGKILDELSESCVDPSECPVCVFNGQRIPEGKSIYLEKNDPQHCQACQFDSEINKKNENNAATLHILLSIDLKCLSEPTDPEIDERRYECNKMMDLAFLVDGSSKLSENDFEIVKTFIVDIMEKIHISQKRIRVSVVQYTSKSAPKLFGLNENKRLAELVQRVRKMKYIGSTSSSTFEGLKYVSHYVFREAPRENAPKIAMLLTASRSSSSSKSLEGILKMIVHKHITVIPVALGPDVKMDEINLIQSKSTMNKPYILENVLELEKRREEIISYLCDLAPEPTMASILNQYTTPPSIITEKPHRKSAIVPLITPNEKVIDFVFCIEGSEKVGESNFNLVKEFLETLIQRMAISEETIHITIIQFSYTVTVEYSFTEKQSKEDIIQRIREIKYQGGNSTNTGKAINFVSENIFTQTSGSRDQVPHLVYMVTSNPPTDVITSTDKTFSIFPITVGPDVDIHEFDLITTVDNLIKLTDYKQLINEAPDLVLNTCCKHPAYCEKPMDVIFILDGSSNVSPSQFEDMKTFVKTFIEKINTGNKATQVSVLQYGMSNTMEIAWTDPQDKNSLIQIINHIQKRENGPGRIGEALMFAIQSVISKQHGGRPEALKVAVLVVTDRSFDQVKETAESAAVNTIYVAELSIFPIGIGPKYDEDELRILAGPSANNKIIKLQSTEQLPTMVMVKNDFIQKLCYGSDDVCIDEDGKIRKPGETWKLLDQCYTVTCQSGGNMSIESNRVRCENVPKPLCPNQMAAIKISEPCGCSWTCPCTCIGSSTWHIATFDGLQFKLLGKCSYVLLNDKEHNLEITLENSECDSENHHICMNSINVKYNHHSIQLVNNMKVFVNGTLVTTPYRSNQYEVIDYGYINEIHIPTLNLKLSFTPMNNEFMLQLNKNVFSSKALGLCGNCDQSAANDFTLHDGSVTADSNTFIKDWTVADSYGSTCEITETPCTDPVSPQCDIIMSEIFKGCHKQLSPDDYYASCKKSSCHGDDPCKVIASYSNMCRIHGVCVNWRTPDFCAMHCELPMVYNHCHLGCNRECGETSGVQCSHHPTEGCFCPDGDVKFKGSCVSENVCTQCTDQYGEDHQHLETWIPPNDPCDLCICLDNRMINCSSKPCPPVKPIMCGPCEVLRLKKTFDQCCPEYECVCDTTCDETPVPPCEKGFAPVLTNPGKCKANYECVCRKETCEHYKSPKYCPAYKKLIQRKTECCDEYECVCSCTDSIITCQAGYISSIVTNECGCKTVTCLPDKVCVHSNHAYSIGSTWENGCQTCSCTEMVDDITQLHISECTEKTCNEDCKAGFRYVKKDNGCCGKCVRAVCEQKLPFRGQGDFDMPESNVHYYNVGSSWVSPNDPCIINECIQVNDEIFVMQKNVSCSEINTKKCPAGYELTCMQGSECCPLCRCEPIPGCPINGTIIGPSQTVMLDACSTCECTLERGPILSYKLSCRKTMCQRCPKNYMLEKVSGSCCGKCVSMGCPVTLQNGTVTYMKPNESIRDGCNYYSCRSNALGELTRETRIQECSMFNREKCLEGGGKIKKLDDTCCETCVEPECRQITGVLKYIRVDDCMTEGQLNIQYCEGKCTSKSLYAIETHSMEDQCVCCSASHTEAMLVSLRCTNGTVVQHEILQAKNCECLSHKCTK